MYFSGDFEEQLAAGLSYSMLVAASLVTGLWILEWCKSFDPRRFLPVAKSQDCD